MPLKDYDGVDPLGNQNQGNVQFPEGQDADTLNDSTRAGMVDQKNGTPVLADTYADLKALLKARQANNAAIKCLGKNSVNDGLGGTFIWDSASTEADNGETVLELNVGGAPDPGRFIAIESPYLSNIIEVTDPTATTKGAEFGIGRKRTLQYRVTGIPENSTKQVFKFALAAQDQIGGFLRVEALSDTNSIGSGLSVGWFKMQRISSSGAAASSASLITSTGFAALAKPVASSNEIVFGINIPNNSTAASASVDFYITLYSDDPDNFVFTGLDGATDHTGSVASNATASDDDIVPLVDNAFDLGRAGLRMKEIFATNTTINPSDAEMKSNIGAPPDALLDAIAATPIGLWQWDDAIAEKGDGARLHSGIVIQDFIRECESRGVDPGRYGAFCRDILEDGREALQNRPVEMLWLMVAELRRQVAALKP